MTTEKTPLVLLPGLLCNAQLWAYQVNALSNEASIFIPDLTKNTSIQEMAAAVLNNAPPQFSLAALSMGGYVAFEIMRQAPERVTRLALLDTSANPDTAARAQSRRDLLALAENGRFIGVSPKLLPKLIHPKWFDSPISALVIEMANQIGKEGFVRQQQAILDRPDVHELIRKIQVPTLILVGADDQLTPVSEAEYMHSQISGSQLEILPECGHLPPLELPEITTELLKNWLKQEV